MSIQPVITLAGHLVVETAEVSDLSERALSPAAVTSLREAFAQSPAAGLVQLCSAASPGELPPEFVFWREFAQSFFHELCGLSEDDLRKAVSRGKARGAAIEPPEEPTLTRLVEDAPPMRGLEYLTPVVQRNLWNELRDDVLARAAKDAEGPAAFLRRLNPQWNLLGRVTFHLAENKRDPARPFAFLATYTHRMSAQAKLQHLPLAEALKQYAGRKTGRNRPPCWSRCSARPAHIRSCARCWIRGRSFTRRHGRSLRRIAF
jgi:non-specific serine/threonine protein kinase